MSFSSAGRILLIALILALLSSVAFAMSQEERDFLLMYFTEDEIQVVSTTRSLKSISRVAENVEIVTAKDIELMNAHTLADVLNTVNGVQVEFFGASPGSVSSVQIQGSRMDQVTVLFDGINIASVGGGAPDPSLIPARIIEKVEVIKGPASSAWGSSLGGIVNVITKSPSRAEGIGGLLYGSYAERNTGDFNGEVRGRKDKLGFYASAGRLQSKGIEPWSNVWQNDVYSKVTYDFAGNTSAAFTFFYQNNRKNTGDWEDSGFSIYQQGENLFSTLSINSRLSDDVALVISGRTASQSNGNYYTPFGEETSGLWSFRDNKYGGSVKVNWHAGEKHDMVFGADYDFNREKDPDLGRFDQEVIAIWANDTIKLGPLSITPGLRFDSVKTHNTTLKEDFVSPSLGVTYDVADKTLLRGYVSRGFNLPSLGWLTSSDLLMRPNPDLKLEKVWSYQLGAETGALRYVWLKVSGFWHEMSDAIVTKTLDPDAGTWEFANESKLRRTGIEFEMRTIPVYNFTLIAGTTYIHSKDLVTGERQKDNPDFTVDFGLQYDDRKSFRTLLKGHYISWNLSPDSDGNDKGMIFDLVMNKSLYRRDMCNLDLFVNGHNIFNGSQYPIANYKNASRWVEAGVKVRF